MRSRAIDNYLSPQERELITVMIKNSMARFQAYDGRLRMAPRRFNTDDLQKLYIEKYGEWSKTVKTKVPDGSSTYLDLIRSSDNLSACPIEQFLKALMQLIEQAIPPSKLNNMLQKLETDLTQCEYPCLCPSEP